MGSLLRHAREQVAALSSRLRATSILLQSRGGAAQHVAMYHRTCVRQATGNGTSSEARGPGACTWCPQARQAQRLYTILG